MIRRSRFRSAAALLFLALAAPGLAEASDICDRLQARLVNMPETPGATGNTRIYSNAISRQTIEMRKLHGDMRRLGCSSGSVIVYGNPNARSCDMLDETLAEMEDNLQRLETKRREVATTAGDVVQRRRLLAALDANGCADPGQERLEASVGEKKIHRNILRDLPPPDEGVPMLHEDGDGVTNLSLDGAPLHSNLRTLCVRTCDGSFFPISSNASPMNFARDAAICSQRCPGTQTELFYHALETQEADQMVSVATGQPYSLLPNAFAYRTRDVNVSGACGCNAAALETNRDPSAQPRKMRTDSGSVTTIGTPQGVAENKQETILPAEERPYDPGKKVRIVGPTFLPQEETSIDLRNPANPAVQ